MFCKQRLRFDLRLCVHFELWTFAWSARLWYDINQNSFPRQAWAWYIYYTLCTVWCTFDWDVVQTVSHICDSCHIACFTCRPGRCTAKSCNSSFWSKPAVEFLAFYPLRSFPPLPFTPLVTLQTWPCLTYTLGLGAISQNQKTGTFCT